MLRTLQAGRALAAIAVAAFHLSIIMGETRYGGLEVFRDYTRLGNRGVDFFFVLSGFIIVFAHSEDIGVPSEWSNYVYRRFVRLFPIYWLYTLVFVCLLGFVGGADAKMPTSIADWITSITLIRFTAVSPPIPVAWTLFHELAFYTIFSILILSRRVGTAAFVIFMLLPFFHELQPHDTNTAFNVYTSRFNWNFVFGMGAFWLYKKGGRGFIELGAGVFFFAVGIAKAPFPEELSPLLLVLGFALMLAGVTKLERSKLLAAPHWLAFTGDASYTLYLLHSNLEGTLLKVAMKTHLQHWVGPGGTYIAVLAGTVVLGCVAYQLVERPLLGALRRRTRNSTVHGEPGVVN